MAVRFLQGVKFSGGSIRFADPTIPTTPFTPIPFTYAYSTFETYNTLNVTSPTSASFPEGEGTLADDNTGRYHIVGHTSKISAIEFTILENTTGFGDVLFRYYSGSVWTTLTSQSVSSFSADQHPAGTFTVTMQENLLNNWQPTVINGKYGYWLFFSPYPTYFTTPVDRTPFYSAKIAGVSGTPVEALTYTVQTFTTPGAGSWTKPNGVTEVIVECWGGGGAGGGASTNNTGGNGGAGGQYVRKTITYGSAQQSIAYSVAASVVGTTGNGTNGNDTTWETNVVIAKGGTGGLANQFESLNAPTGSINNGVGDVIYAGGDATGAGGAFPSGVAGGQGGNHPGAFGFETAVGGQFPGIDYGGVGGDSPFVTTGGTNGLPGSNYGAGGSGAAKVSGGANRSGGAGAQGLIRISYR